MKNILKKLITLFALSVAFISAMSCKLSINKTEETESKTETKLVKITPVLQGISRIAYPDFSSFDVTELGDYYIRAAEKSDDDFGDWLLKEKFATYDDFMSAELYLPEGEFTFLVIAYYDGESDSGDVEFASIFDYTVVAGQENIINIVLKPATEDRFNSKTATLEYTFNIDASINNPKVTSAYCVHGRQYNSETDRYDLLKYDFVEDDYSVTTTDEGTTITFTKTLDMNYGPFVVFNFEDESHNIYQYGTTAVVVEGMTSTEVVNVKKFYKGYPITYHLKDDTTHVEYYATTYGYKLWDAENHVWFEDEDFEVAATEKKGGKSKGAVELWEKGLYSISLVDMDSEEVISTFYTEDSYILRNRSITTSDSTYNFDYFVKGYYENKNINNPIQTGTTFTTEKNKTFYVEKSSLYSLTVIDQDGVTLFDDEDFTVAGDVYFNLDNSKQILSVYAADLISPAVINLGLNKAITNISLSDDYSDSIETGVHLYFGTDFDEEDLIVYIKYDETHTVTLDEETYGEFTYNRFYKLPIEGTNCRVINSSNVKIIDNNVWISKIDSSKSYEDTYVPSVIIQVIDTAAEWAYAVEAVVLESADETPRIPSRRLIGNDSSYYEITDETDYCVAYSYTLEANKTYYVRQINTSANTSYLEECTDAKVIIVDDTTGSVKFNSTASGYSFQSLGAGTYIVYVFDNTSTGIIKAGHALYSINPQKVTPTVSVEIANVGVISDFDEESNVLTLTATDDFIYYKWTLGGTDSNAVELGKTKVIQIPMDNYPFEIQVYLTASNSSLNNNKTYITCIDIMPADEPPADDDRE